MWIDVHRCIYAGTYQGTAKHGATGLNAKAAQPLSESELGLVHSNPPVRLPMQATSAQQLRCCTTCPPRRWWKVDADADRAQQLVPFS